MRGGYRDRGFALLETTLTLIIFTTLLYVVVQIASRADETRRYSSSLAAATEINQDLLQRARSDLLPAVELFQNDAVGKAYLGLLDMSQAKPAIDSVLPTINPRGVFGQEPGAGALTGNTLMFVKCAWTAEYVCATGKRCSLDVYRIVRFYLAAEAGGPAPESPGGLNLCRWVSEPLVDGDGIDRIVEVSDRIEVLEHLLAGDPGAGGEGRPPVHVVWQRGGDPDDPRTLRQIVAGGFLSSEPLAPRPLPWRIGRDDGESSDGLLRYDELSVASNYAHPGIGVGRYSVVNDSGDGFPHGFEVQIIGPPDRRLVLLQLALVSTRGPGLPASSSQRVVIDTRES